MAQSVYVHIPFCKKRCNYCSFTSFNALELKTIYVDVVCREIKNFYKGERLNTLYIGGGTPSLLGIGDFEEISGQFNLDEKTEITVEVNPESAKKEYLKALRKLGVNRLSIGVQSFNDKILKDIGRLHNSNQAQDTIKMAQSTGFENISIDLMYGLPDQDLKVWQQTLQKTLEFDIQHISLYGLKIDKGCYFYNNRPKNLAGDDIQADMYLCALDFLSDFNHYEISNFAKSREFQGRHNLNYWNLGEYWGFGVAASGFVDGRRYTNSKNIEEYIKNPLKEKEFEKSSRQSLIEEFIFLGFRKTEGIDTQELKTRFDVDFESKYKGTIEKYHAAEYMLKTKNGYRLSTEGLLVSNSILCDFLE